MFRNPFSFLFVRSRRDELLAQYVLREFRRGRDLDEILSDPYVLNRSSPDERGRLLERPEIVEAIGDERIASMRRDLAGVPS